MTKLRPHLVWIFFIVAIAVIIAITLHNANRFSPQITEGTIYTEVKNIDGINFKTSRKAYPNNVDEIEFIFENNTDKEYTFGSEYHLEKLEKGKWHQLTYRPSEHDISWTLEGHPLKPNSTRKETLITTHFILQQNTKFHKLFKLTNQI